MIDHHLSIVLAIVHQRCTHCRELVALQVLRVYGRDVFGKVVAHGLAHVSADDHQCTMRRPWRRRLTDSTGASEEARATTEGEP